MGHFEDRLQRKMQKPEFSAGYQEALKATEITAAEGVMLTLSLAMTPTVDIQLSWAAPVYSRVYVPRTEFSAAS